MTLTKGEKFLSSGVVRVHNSTNFGASLSGEELFFDESSVKISCAFELSSSEAIVNSKSADFAFAFAGNKTFS